METRYQAAKLSEQLGLQPNRNRAAQALSKQESHFHQHSYSQYQLVQQSSSILGVLNGGPAVSEVYSQTIHLATV